MKILQTDAFSRSFCQNAVAIQLHIFFRLGFIETEFNFWNYMVEIL